jgi:hypothetical protein
MGRKLARVRPLQEMLLQKRRFWGILVIAINEKSRFPPIMQPASQAGCLFVGFDNSVVWLRGADSGPQHEIVPGFCRLVEPEYE